MLPNVDSLTHRLIEQCIIRDKLFALKFDFNFEVKKTCHNVDLRSIPLILNSSSKVARNFLGS